LDKKDNIPHKPVFSASDAIILPPSNQKMKNISVIGGGTMGNGIAHVFAQNGFQVSLIDVKQEILDKALSTITRNMDRQVAKGSLSEEQKAQALANLTTYTNMSEGVENADLVIEAATENLEIKLNIFRQLDQFAPPHCILASNTSSISITKIGSVTSRPDKIIGMHFMNPVPVMKLVEIIGGFKTTEETAETIVALTRQIGKVPAVTRDYPGFIANRILLPMINEAIYSLDQGVAGVEEIDTIMKLGMAHPMGPLQLADFIGLDVCLAILNVLHDGFKDPKYAPCTLLVNMVTAGDLGAKSGRGFYDYAHGTKDLVIAPNFRRTGPDVHALREN
jgi:3-hydroxybutyryl-CoA dehydrogenase